MIRRLARSFCVVLLLVLSVDPVFAAGAQLPPDVLRAVGPTAEAIGNNLYRVRLDDGLVLTTHGPDPAPDELAEFQPGDPERSPVCATDYYQHVLYGVPVGSVDRSSTIKGQLRAIMRRINWLLDADGIGSGGTHADYKVKCDANGDIQVDTFSTVGGYFTTIVNDARAAGFDEPNADYTIFLDGSFPGLCGVGSFADDEQPGAGNQNNNGNDYAVTYVECWNSRTPMHENGHNQGAVQYNAPYSTGGGHCWALRDVMCYSPDGGDKHQQGTVTLCADRTYYDCGYDDYFDTAPAPGSYLASSWNIGSSVNRFIRFGEPTPNTPPVAAFTSSCSSGTRTCSFVDTSTDVDGTIASRSWNFGDGATSTASAPSHQYAADGTYIVSLRVKDNGGEEGVASRALLVLNQPPVPSFTASCNAGSCFFSPTGSSDPDGSIASWSWTFGDGGTSTDQFPTRVYTAYGSYTVRLAVTDNGGKSASTQQTIVPPIAPLIQSPAPSGLVRTTSVPISGVGPPGASITVKKGTSTIATGNASGSGAWSTSATLLDGSHTIRATAQTAQGTSPQSAAITFTVDTDFTGPPQPSITSPTPNQMVGPLPVVAGDAPGTAKTVVIYEGATRIATGSVQSARFSIPVPLLGAGWRTVHAVALDAQGDPSTPSAAVRFYVDRTPPAIAFTTPEGAIMFRTSAAIEGTVSDDTDVASVSVEIRDTVNNSMFLAVELAPPDALGVRRWVARPGLLVLPGRYRVFASATDVWDQRSPLVSRTVHII